MARSRFDPPGNPVDRKIASDRAAQRRRSATSAGGYKSGPQFSDVMPTSSGSSSKPKAPMFDQDRYAWMSDEKALSEYRRVQAEIAATKDDPMRALQLLEKEMYLRFLLIDRRLSPE